MIKVIVNGCNGAMGQVLSQQLLQDKETTLVAGIDRSPSKLENPYPVHEDIFEFDGEVDVIIDFSKPGSLPKLIEFGVQKNVPLVIATTGFSAEDMELINKASEKIPVFYSANMSLGVNTLITMVRKAASILGGSFDIEIVEKHHNKKVDAPSGTAHMIANNINDELNNSMNYVFGREGNESKRTSNEIGIHAVRGGTIFGEHTVIFAGEDETIEVKHTALSKKIFANGSINAAKYIVNKDKGLYGTKDLLNL